MAVPFFCTQMEAPNRKMLSCMMIQIASRHTSASIPLAKVEVRKNPSNTSNVWVVSMLVYINVALIVHSKRSGETVSREWIWLTNLMLLLTVYGIWAIML